jgi:hypothetical protein
MPRQIVGFYRVWLTYLRSFVDGEARSPKRYRSACGPRGQIRSGELPRPLSPSRQVRCWCRWRCRRRMIFKRNNRDLTRKTFLKQFLLQAAGAVNYDQLLNLCVWVKDNGGMGSFYRSRHELVFVYRNGEAPHRNNIPLGRYGRNRTNVWEYPGGNTMSRQGEEGNLLALHPTVKPFAMIADALLDCSAPKDIVLDPFVGSGTTLIAAEKSKRVCYGLELSPKYVDVAIRRRETFTGRRAIHSYSGHSFSECTAAQEASHFR